MNPIPGMIADDFTLRVTLAANNILDRSNNADTNDFNHRLEAATNGIIDESLTRRRRSNVDSQYNWIDMLHIWIHNLYQELYHQVVIVFL